MGLAIKPIECPGGCLGCYEKDIRESGNAPAFEIDKVLATLAAQMALDKENKWNSPTLHGGEPLLLPLTDIGAILGMVFEKYGHSGIQTSGALIRPEHIPIFQKNKTHVGISIDGDKPSTNFGRWNAPGFNVREKTADTLENMRLLKDAGIATSTITVLRKCNAGTPELRADLVRFGLRIRNEFGATSARFNPLIAFDERTAREEELDAASLADVFLQLSEMVFLDPKLQWRPMLDFAAVLKGESVECAFCECDPWSTDAEIPILGDGSLGVCLKGGGGPDGVTTLRVEKSSARYEALAQVCQEAGGCRGCFWWPYCKGGCPGAGLGGDWRNRTRFCLAYRSTFEYIIGLPLFDTIGKCHGGKVGGHGDKQHGDSDDPTWRAANPWWKGEHK